MRWQLAWLCTQSQPSSACRHSPHRAEIMGQAVHHCMYERERPRFSSMLTSTASLHHACNNFQDHALLECIAGVHCWRHSAARRQLGRLAQPCRHLKECETRLQEDARATLRQGTSQFNIAQQAKAPGKSSSCCVEGALSVTRSSQKPCKQVVCFRLRWEVPDGCQDTRGHQIYSELTAGFHCHPPLCQAGSGPALPGCGS